MNPGWSDKAAIIYRPAGFARTGDIRLNQVWLRPSLSPPESAKFKFDGSVVGLTDAHLLKSSQSSRSTRLKIVRTALASRKRH